MNINNNNANKVNNNNNNNVANPNPTQNANRPNLFGYLLNAANDILLNSDDNNNDHSLSPPTRKRTSPEPSTTPDTHLPQRPVEKVRALSTLFPSDIQNIADKIDYLQNLADQGKQNEAWQLCLASTKTEMPREDAACLYAFQLSVEPLQQNRLPVVLKYAKDLHERYIKDPILINNNAFALQYLYAGHIYLNVASTYGNHTFNALADAKVVFEEFVKYSLCKDAALMGLGWYTLKSATHLTRLNKSPEAINILKNGLHQLNQLPQVSPKWNNAQQLINALYSKLGYLYRLDKNYTKAKEVFSARIMQLEKIPQDTPQYNLVLHDLAVMHGHLAKTSISHGSFLESQGRRSEARAEYQNAIDTLKKAPIHPSATCHTNSQTMIDAYTKLGFVEHVLKEYAQAQVALRVAINLSNNHLAKSDNPSQLNMNIGHLYSKLGDLKTKTADLENKVDDYLTAIEHYKKVPKDSPVYEKAYIKTCDLYCTLGRLLTWAANDLSVNQKYCEADKLYTQAIEYLLQAPSHPETTNTVRYLLGYAYVCAARSHFLSGNIDQATKLFSVATNALKSVQQENHPSFGDATYYMGLVHYFRSQIFRSQRKMDQAQSELENAINVWNAILKLRSCAKINLTLYQIGLAYGEWGDAKRLQGKKEDAESLYNTAINLLQGAPSDKDQTYSLNFAYATSYYGLAMLRQEDPEKKHETKELLGKTVFYLSCVHGPNHTTPYETVKQFLKICCDMLNKMG